jgi:hypothetical protein
MTPHCHKNGLCIKHRVLWLWSVIHIQCTWLSPFLCQWSVIPILDTQSILMTMRCHSYTWYTVHSYDSAVSFLYLILRPVLWQWGVFHTIDTQPSLMTMRCLSYTWQCHSYTVYLTLSPFLWQWSVIPILDTQPRLDCVSSIGMTLHCHKTGLSVKYRNDTS